MRLLLPYLRLLRNALDHESDDYADVYNNPKSDKLDVQHAGSSGEKLRQMNYLVHNIIKAIEKA